MTLTDLQRAAARPYRFESSLLKKRLANRTPEPMKPITGTQNHNFVFAKIIPGGQYLVTAGATYWGGYTARDGPVESFTSEILISVWDIRPPAASNISRVAEFKVEPYQGEKDASRQVLHIQSIGIRLDEKGRSRAALITVRSVNDPDAEYAHLPSLRTRIQKLNGVILARPQPSLACRSSSSTHRTSKRHCRSIRL